MKRLMGWNWIEEIINKVEVKVLINKIVFI